MWLIFLSVTHFFQCGTSLAYFCKCDPFFQVWPICLRCDPDTPVTHFLQSSPILGGVGRWPPKSLGKILTFYNRLKLGVQTRCKPASQLQALDRKVKLSQRSPTRGEEGGDIQVHGENLDILNRLKLGVQTRSMMAGSMQKESNKNTMALTGKISITETSCHPLE